MRACNKNIKLSFSHNLHTQCLKHRRKEVRGVHEIMSGGRGNTASVPCHVVKTYEGVEVQRHLFLTKELDQSEWLGSRPDRSTP